LLSFAGLQGVGFSRYGPAIDAMIFINRKIGTIGMPLDLGDFYRPAAYRALVIDIKSQWHRASIQSDF
jgi:hypothetical protein